MGNHATLDMQDGGSGAQEGQASPVDGSHPPWAQYTS
jgi:hypothetical protein